MTISTTPSEKSYQGDNVSTSFPIPFVFGTAGDLKVIRTDSVGNISQLITGWSVSGGNGSTGTLTLTSPLASGHTLTILDDPERSQATSYVSNDAFPAQVQEFGLDKLTRLVKRLHQRLERTFRTRDGDPASGEAMIFPTVAARRGKFAFWSDDSIANLEPAVGLPIGTPLAQSIIGQLLYPQTAAEAAAGVAPVNYAYAPGNIRRYGAVVDGATDDSAAVRKALDLAARDGTTATCAPPGTIKINSTVYIPQRILPEGAKGFRMDFYGSTFRGQGRGVGTIFESGTGALATGGASNFGQADESDQALHYGTVIAGARFRECGTALRLFNWVKGCKLEDLWLEDVDKVVYTDRCFYLELFNIHAQIAAISPGAVLFDFNDTSNAMTIMGCEASGGAGNVNGTGYKFTFGGSGIIFHNNTAEGLDRGVVINGGIQSIDIRQCYFESIATTAIDATSAGSKTMEVSGCWFVGVPECIDAAEWVAGTWREDQYIDSPGGGVIRINDAASICTVEIPLQGFTEAQANASAAIVPSRYVLSNTVRLQAPRFMYAASAGYSAPIAYDAGHHGTMPWFQYGGGNAQVGAGRRVPFVTQTLTSGNSVFDTQITWSDYQLAVIFDLYTEINSVARRFRGLVLASGFVQRFDALANFTVTATNNANKLRITIAGADHAGLAAAGYWGQIRHL